MSNYIQPFLDKYRLKGRILPESRLGDLENDFKRVLETGLIDSRVVEVYLGNFSFVKPEGMKDLGSVVVISMARPAHRLKLNYKGENIGVIIPPTYVNYQKINGKIFNLFKKWMGEKGHSVYVARLPLKLLSVRSGLARYGKNNISYLNGWGSFHQLSAFYTDFRVVDDPWQKKKALDACGTCDLCLKSCPTGAIKQERFLLDAGVCLTFLNESEEEMPAWVGPGVHNSLIGCMRCQEVCPYNSKVRDWVEDIGELDEDETDMLLSFDSEEDKDSPIIKKTKELGIYEFFAGLIPRNLGLLLKKNSGRKK